MFCGVSAMLSRAFPIAYKVALNGTQIGSGEASFDLTVERNEGAKGP